MNRDLRPGSDAVRAALNLEVDFDIAVIDPGRFMPVADYANPVALSRGVDALLINGVTVLDPQLQVPLPGRVLRKKPGGCPP